MREQRRKAEIHCTLGVDMVQSFSRLYRTGWVFVSRWFCGIEGEEAYEQG